jgi:hypothetical protein
MDVMGVSKAAAAGAVPFASPAVAPAVSGPVRGLTIKLDGPLYSALREYCHQQERATGQRVTHQAVMVQALRELLARQR